MVPKLAAIVDSVRTLRVNPGGRPLDAGKLLQMRLLEAGAQSEFTEDDLFRALEALGVPEEEQINWFEDFASYL